MNEIIYAVVMLFQVSGQNVIGTATGFFYESNEKLYLITNKHVLNFSINNEDPKIHFKIHTDSTDFSKQHEVIISLKENEKLKWYYLSNDIDVAAIPINKEILEKGIIYPLSSKNFPTENIHLSIGEELYAIGFPRGFTDKINLTPIVKSVTISTPPQIPFEGKPMMLLDGHLLPGMSGSPIITKPSTTQFIKGGISVSNKERFFFIGIHSASIYKTIGYKEEPIYKIDEEGQIKITGFKKEKINENLGLQTCIFNGIIEVLVSQIK